MRERKRGDRPGLNLGARSRRRTAGRPWPRAVAVLAAALVAGCGAGATADSPDGASASVTTGPIPSPNPFPNANKGDKVRTCTAAQVASRVPPIIFRPTWLSRGQPAPLLIALHGATGFPQAMEGLSHFQELANQQGFVVALLGACDLAHPWGAPQDLTYISSMIKRMTTDPSLAGAIDPARVYVTGYSAGGAETWLDGCRLSRQVAAIAVVSDAMNGALYSSCSLARPVPELLIVGSADSTRWTGVPRRLPNPFQTTARWRQLDGCPPEAPQVQNVSTVTQQTWGGCADGSAVALYVVAGGGHVWPPYGVGAPQDYFASRAVWAFVSAFRGAPLSLPRRDARLLSVRSTAQSAGQDLVTSLATAVPIRISVRIRASGHRQLRRVWALAPTGSGGQTLRLRIPWAPGAASGTAQFMLRDSYGRTRVITRSLPG